MAVIRYIPFWGLGVQGLIRIQLLRIKEATDTFEKLGLNWIKHSEKNPITQPYSHFQSAAGPQGMCCRFEIRFERIERSNLISNHPIYERLLQP